MFEKWCLSSKTDTFEHLCELVLLEDFKKSVPEKVVQYLNEQKVTTLAEAAVLADKFVLMHYKVFSKELPFTDSSAKNFVGEEAPSQNIFFSSRKTNARPKMNVRNSMHQGGRRV